MTAGDIRRRLRVPPRVVRLGIRHLGRRSLDPRLPWDVQRHRLDRLTRTAVLPRGTAVARRDL
ncbi:MAG: hypothetical protein J2P27_11735, partial [Actinobacteria bacterium]|nr:hypothetical protein [Actinomycetota bacterium]